MRLPLIAASVLAGSFLSTAGAQFNSQVPTPPKVPAAKVPAKPVVTGMRSLQGVPLTSNLVNGSDDCSTAQAQNSITGTGSFAFDSTAATTGAPTGSCGLIGTDVWFYYTAASAGLVTVDTCGTAAHDTVLAVWADGVPAGSCPTTQLACNDDNCGLQSSVSFNAAAGVSYFIEVGSFAGGAGGAGTINITQSAPPTGPDDCSAPIVITGTGSFNVDNTAATTTAPVGSCGAMGNDVWYRWTAPMSGAAIINTCGGVAGDSVIAVWDGLGIPAGSCPTTQLACNDDTCGLQSQVVVPVVGGQDYFIELGGFGGATYVGTFAISISQPPANDSCATPTAVVGNGPHNFDTTLATTGTEGQTEGLCLAFGSTAIYNDVWFTWTAPTTSQYEVSLCGGTGYDTRVAVYAGAGCPAPGTAIACNDDFCGLVSAACFSATAGQTYTIQIGAFGTTGLGLGQFAFAPAAPPAGGCTPQDDGTSENSVGLTAGGAMAWMVGFGAAGGSQSVSAIDTCFGTPGFPGGYVPTGPVTIALWDDPNDDGDPSDAVLLATASAAVAPGSIDTDVFQSIPLAAPVVVNGVFFVGATVNHLAGEFPGPLDQSAAPGGACGSGGAGSWVFGDTTGTLDLNVLTNNNVPPASMASVGLPGNWLLRVNCGPGNPGTPYCFGDGTGTACPCGNNSTQAGTGCQHSFSVGSYGGAGALLVATGNPSISGDTIQLQGTQMPPSTSCLFFQGTSPINAVFGDGIRCVGGTVIRLGQRAVSGGARNFGFGVAGDPAVSVQGAVTPGSRFYSIWYRNVAPFCTPSGFNLSNGLELVWVP